MIREINIKASDVIGMDIKHNGVNVGKVIGYKDGIMTAFIDNEYKDMFKVQNDISMEVRRVEKVR